MLKKLFYSDIATRSFIWDNEKSPSTDQAGKVTLIVYFVLVKCLLVRILLKSSSDMTEIEERNTRALCLLVYRIARQAGQESILEMDSQFKRAVQGFAKSSDEANAWNDTTLKPLFKAFTNEIKINSMKLTEWANLEITATEPSDLPPAIKEEVLKEEQQISGINSPEAISPRTSTNKRTSLRRGSLYSSAADSSKAMTSEIEGAQIR